MSLPSQTSLTQPISADLGRLDSAMRIGTTVALWLTVTGPVAAILGYVPLENIQKMQIGYSIHDLKYRSVGAAFLANQRGEQLESIIRIDLLVNGPKRFLLLGALKELFELNLEGPKQVSANKVPSSFSGSLLASSGGTGKLVASSYLNTFPFFTSSAFLSSVYIESLFWDESVERPNTFLVNILLRTWKNQWKDTSSEAATGLSTPVGERNKVLNAAFRVITNTGVAGTIWSVANQQILRMTNQQPLALASVLGGVLNNQALGVFFNQFLGDPRI